MSWSAGVDTQRLREQCAVGTAPGGEGAVVVEGVPTESRRETDTPQWRGWLTRVGDDWLATVVAGVITALAVADVLPKIPW